MRVDPVHLSDLNAECFPGDGEIVPEEIDWAWICYEHGPQFAMACGFICYVTFPEAGPGVWQLLRYGVKPQWRRLGLGALLLSKRPYGAKRIETYTIDNPPSEAALKGAGYNYLFTDDFDGQTLNYFRWEK